MSNQIAAGKGASSGQLRMSRRVMNLAYMLTQNARRHGDRTGFVWGENAWTWREIDAEVSALAAALAARGVAKGDRILVHSKNCAEMFWSMFAAFRLGAVWVPTNFRLMPDEVAYLATATNVPSGNYTSLALTFGDGVHIFTLDRDTRVFRLAIPKVAIPQDSAEYAIDTSNYRHWGDSVRAYVDDCVTGLEGPLAQDYNMHWVASLVAEAYRILARGGVFLSPADERRGYVAGRHRLIYEANPISFLIEQAGGAAADTVQRILDLRPTELHARTPFVFGSSGVVHRIVRYHTDPQFSAEREPLFTRRGLLRL